MVQRYRLSKIMNLTSRQKIIIGVGITSVVIIIISILLGSYSNSNSLSSGSSKETTKPESTNASGNENLPGSKEPGLGTGNENNAGNSSPGKNANANNSSSGSEVVNARTDSSGNTRETGKKANGSNSSTNTEPVKKERGAIDPKSNPVNNAPAIKNPIVPVFNKQESDTSVTDGNSVNSSDDSIDSSEHEVNLGDKNIGKSGDKNSTPNSEPVANDIKPQTPPANDNSVKLMKLKCGKDKKSFCGKYDLKLPIQGLVKHVTIFYALENEEKLEDLRKKIESVIMRSPQDAETVIKGLDCKFVDEDGITFGISGLDSTSPCEEIYPILMSQSFTEYIEDPKTSNGDTILNGKNVLFIISKDKGIRLSPKTKQKETVKKNTNPISLALSNDQKISKINLDSKNCGKDGKSICGLYEIKFRGRTDAKYKIFYGLENTEEKIKGLKTKINGIISKRDEKSKEAFDRFDATTVKMNDEDAFGVYGLVDAPPQSYEAIYNQILTQGFLTSYNDFAQKGDSEKILKGQDFVIIVSKTADKFYQLGLDAPSAQEQIAEIELKHEKCGKKDKNICGEYELEIPGKPDSKFKLFFALDNESKLKSLKNLIENLRASRNIDLKTVSDELDAEHYSHGGSVFGVSGIKKAQNGVSAEEIYEKIKKSGFMKYLSMIQNAKGKENVLKEHNFLFIIPENDANYSEFILNLISSADKMLLDSIKQHENRNLKQPQPQPVADVAEDSDHEVVSDNDYGILTAEGFKIFYRCENKEKLKAFNTALSSSFKSMIGKAGIREFINNHLYDSVSQLWYGRDVESDEEDWGEGNENNGEQKVNEDDKVEISIVKTEKDMLYNEIKHRSFKEFLLDICYAKYEVHSGKNVLIVLPPNLADNVELEKERVDLNAKGTAEPNIQIISEKKVSSIIDHKKQYNVKLQTIDNVFKQENLFGIFIEYTLETKPGNVNTGDAEVVKKTEDAEFESYENYKKNDYVTIYDGFTVIHGQNPKKIKGESVITALDSLKEKGFEEFLSLVPSLSHFRALLVTKNKPEFDALTDKFREAANKKKAKSK